MRISANVAPTLANAIPDQRATVGTLFSYQVPATTFNDADTSDTLAYAATKADDSMLPTWLVFTASTRTFAGTPMAGDTGTVSVKVTASDGDGGSVSDEFDITVAPPTGVPADWSLKPADVAAGAKFRLLFLSSTKRNGSSTDIATYNTFVQDRAAAGHTDIQTYSAGFRAVGCTAAVDARDNTATTYTSTDKGVPIYWLNGAKAADDYEDFYDGSWDDEANGKNESGTDVPDTSSAANQPITGCDHDGTEDFFNTDSRALGVPSPSSVRVGKPNSSATGDGPISSGEGALTTASRSLYGLSDVFQVSDPNAGICPRTEAVRDAILAKITGVTDCALVTDTHLAAITSTLSLNAKSITVLAAGDFDGLTALTTLNLSFNSLTALPAGIFDELTALTWLNLTNNSLTALPAGVFDKLTALTLLHVNFNSLTALPAGVFDELTALTSLDLENNSLTALPAGVFDGLTALTTLDLDTNSLTALPDDVFEPLTSLTTLDLSGNPGAPFSPSAVALPDDGTVPAAGGTVMLDGSGSGGAWGTNVTYAWALTTPTSGVTVTFDDAASAEPTVTIPQVTADTDLVFTLTVTGRAHNSSTSTSTGTDTATVTTTTTTTNAAPTVANGIPDQTATAGTAFTYQFPANTFNDTDTGDTLSYTATKPDDSTLPTWLTFDAATRTFTGTPAAGDLGMVSVKVTATDTSSATVSNEFNITVSATAPGAPTSLSATASGSTTINLSWTAPASDGGSAITGYKIEVSSDGGSTWNDLVANTGNANTTYAHSGLAASTTRHYRVSAINGIGTSATTSNVANTTTDAATATVPGAPTSLSATASGSTTINLSWTAPSSDGGSAITGYKIEISTDGGSNWNDLVANTGNANTTYAHSGLAASTTRHYRVSAINGIGTSATTSNVANATTGAATAPGAATSLSATSSGSSTIDLSWTAPASTGGAAITGYKIEFSSDSGSNWSDLVANTGNANTTYAHSGLTASTTRHYRVSAINGIGTSATTSNVANATTDAPTATVPGAPTSLSATASGSTAIDLSWTVPSSTGGSAITGYLIEVSSDGGSNWSDLVADTGNANTTYAHTGLADGATRHYRVSAINSNGTGTHSNVANATAGRTTVTFNASSYTAEESGAPAAVTVEMGAVPSSAVTIPLVVTHLGGATTGDYEGLPSSVTFWTTGRSRTFRVRAIDDSDVDGGESVQIGFGTLPTGYAAGTHQTATVALVDDETELIVDFGTGAPSTPIYVRESDTDLHRITVTLRTSRYSAPDGNPRQPVTIPLVVTHRGGATPDDYEGLPSSVTFAVGESVTGFDMRAIPDRTSETGEGLRLDFGSLPSGVRKGSLGPYETIEFVDEAASVPGAPTSLSATSSGSSTIDLSWSAPASTGGSVITGYKIEVSSNGGSSWSVLVADTGNANTTYAHSGLTASTTRHYRVSAINSNANGTGSPSNVDDATTGTTVPGAPTSLSATASGSSTIDLSWTAPASTGGSAITGYKIEVSSDGGSNWSDLVADTGNANTTYAHTGLADGATRHYRVSAINANGTGTHSNVANATAGRTTVTFNASSYTAEESGAPAAVTVELGEVPSSAVTIPLVVTHLGGATTGDYEGLPSSVTFWTTGRSRTFRVRAIDDSDVDGGESVQIGFGTLPTGYAAGTHQTATVALVDDETELIVDFGTGAPSTPIYVRESDTDLHRITVTLRTSRYSAPDGNPRQPVTIPLVVTHRGGATPDDYEGLPSSVTFAVGESVTGFDMRAIPDRTSETGEGLRLDFGSLPSGVRKGSLGPYETIEFVDAAAAQANLSVAGPLLTLVYREALDGASKPLPRDFVVTAQMPGGARTMVAVRAVSVRGSDVLLDLDRPVTPEETVTLTYLAAAMHPIRDAAGRLAPLLANEPVRNDTGADGPLEEKALADAAGLEAARDGAGTERLDLSSRNLTDISALAGLTGVVELDLRDNAITDLWPLAGLTQLRVLNLRDNAITDLGPLAGLTGLQVLDLSGNQVADLWPLAGLAALERLNLSGNRVAEIATLAQLTGLRAVDLADNRVADLWPLAGLAALERLNLSDNRIEDLWPLASLSDLRVLLLDRNRVADLLALSHVAGLENLGLSGNRIEDVGWLAELGRLHRLDLSGNAVADVSALGDVSKLVWLRLSGNPVTNPYPLGRLQMLRWLWLNPGAAARMEALAPLGGRGAHRCGSSGCRRSERREGRGCDMQRDLNARRRAASVDLSEGRHPIRRLVPEGASSQDSRSALVSGAGRVQAGRSQLPSTCVPDSFGARREGEWNGIRKDVLLHAPCG